MIRRRGVGLNRRGDGQRGTEFGATPIAGGGPSPLIDYSADITFSRSAVATRFVDGVWYDFASNEAPILSDGSISLAGSRTNGVRYSIPDANTLANGTTWTLDVEAAPNGDPTGSGIAAAQITNTGAGGRYQFITGEPTANVVVSAFLKRVSADGTVKLGANSFSPVTDVAVPFSADWTRPSAKISCDGTGFFSFRLNDQLFYIWGMSFEWGSGNFANFAGPYIESIGGAATTRDADVAYVPSASVSATMKSGSWSVEAAMMRPSTEAADTATETLFAWGAGLDNRIFVDASNQIVVRQGGVDVVTTSPLTWSSHQTVTHTFNSSAGSVTVSGAASGDGVYTGSSWTMPSGDMHLGNDAATGTAAFVRLGRPQG